MPVLALISLSLISLGLSAKQDASWVVLEDMDYESLGFSEDKLIELLDHALIPDINYNPSNLSDPSQVKEDLLRRDPPFDPAHPPLMTDANRGVTASRTGWSSTRTHSGGFIVSINGRAPSLDEQGISYIIDNWRDGNCMTQSQINACMALANNSERTACAEREYPRSCTAVMTARSMWQLNEVQTPPGPRSISVTRTAGVSSTEERAANRTMNIQVGVAFWGFSSSIGWDLGVSMSDTRAWSTQSSVSVTTSLAGPGFKYAFWQTNTLYETFILPIRNGNLDFDAMTRINQWTTGNAVTFDDVWRINF